MGFLARLAKTEGGTSRLVGECRLLELLKETSLLAASPPPAFAGLSQETRDDPATSLLARYYMIAESVLELLLALVTGPEAQPETTAVAKVLGFLCANGEAIMWLFGGRSSDSSESSLLKGPVSSHPSTVALLTGVLARACTVPIDISLAGAGVLELETGRDSFLRGLLGFLQIAGDYPSHLKDCTNEDATSVTQLRFRGGLGRAAPLASREALGQAWSKASVTQAILSSILHCLHCFSSLTSAALEKADEKGLDAVIFTEPSMVETGPKASVSLGSLTQTLKTCLGEWVNVGERLESVRLALSDLPELAIEELHALETHLAIVDCKEDSRPLRASAIRHRLLELGEKLKAQRRLLKEALSESLFLLWAYLDYFLRLCAPTSELGDLGPSIYSLLTHRPKAEQVSVEVSEVGPLAAPFVVVGQRDPDDHYPTLEYFSMELRGIQFFTAYALQ